MKRRDGGFLIIALVFMLSMFIYAVDVSRGDEKNKGLSFSESYEDGDLHSRGWYDGNKFKITEKDTYAGKGCIEYHWQAEGTTPVSSSGSRHLIEATEVVYLRFYMRLSEGWGWSGRSYHPHLIDFMTTENSKYHGPAASRLTVCIEPVNGKLRLAAADIQNKSAPHGPTQGELKGGYNGKKYESEEVLFDDAKWHCVEAMFKMNSLDMENDKPNRDGELRGWFDDKLVIEDTEVIFRSTDFAEMKFNQLLVVPYFGPGLLPHAQTLWIDELAVGTERIGPLKNAPSILRPKPAQKGSAVSHEMKWTHLSSKNGDIPAAGVGRQAASLILDIDKDGVNDFVIAGWSDETSMVWFRHTPDGWKRYLIDNRKSHIEAGGAYYDIDGDGDPDILQGGSWVTNEVWWWENPYPDYEANTPWNRYTIKDWGEKQHHDQIFGDFDGDGQAELVFWNQNAKKLLIADIPDEPKAKENWSFTEIWSWPSTFKYEGFDKADVDMDGKTDLIGGGMWFKHTGGKSFTAKTIDADYGMSRAAVGDLIKGGWPEIVLNSGDGVGPLNLYEWKGSKWVKDTLIERVDHGHTLQVGDINGDGNLDIYAAEMYRPGAGKNCKQWVLYGDGRGKFATQLISTGIGTHEGRIGDLDGDGDLDILQKDFQEQQRVDIWLNNGTHKAKG